MASTAASENGARQCARDYWECTHLPATQSQIPIEEESCPPCKYSLGQTSTNLIRFCGRTVLLGETCSQRELLLSVPKLLGSQLHHRNSWTSSGAAATRRAKSVVDGHAMDPMECRVLATVSAKEACLL